MVLNTNRNYDVVNGENIPIRVSFYYFYYKADASSL